MNVRVCDLWNGKNTAEQGNPHLSARLFTFSPANVVPGIGFPPDRMLRGRLFSYGDTHRYRLGINHHQIPVNAPRYPFHSFHCDGAGRVDGNLGGTFCGLEGLTR